MKHFKKILLIAIPIVIVIGVAVVALNAWSSGPSEGSVRILSPQETATPVAEAKPLTIDTSIFLTTLPNGFIQKSTSAVNPPQMSIRALANNIQSRLQVSFTAGTLPSDGLSGLGDYNLRDTQTTSYKRSTNSAIPTGAVAFEDTAGSMVTVFWPHATSYAEMTITGDPSTTANQYRLLSKILQTWQWK